MKTPAMLKRMRLAEDSLARIAEAVRNAEAKTSGEIALALIAESGDYSFWELFFSVTAGALAFALLLPFSPAIAALLDRAFWTAPVWQLPAFFGVTGFGIVAILFMAASIPALDRIVVPARVRSATVRHRAFRHFAESGVYATAGHSGVLVFVSYLEREVRVVADTGISGKISADLWKLIADELAAGIKGGGSEAAFIRAAERCGELLAQYFPAEAEGDNPNELRDGLTVLEADEW
ncbi:TPM domain-containing protein [Treponema endosymbiont of Eucomonympha sp.]|uniref:TPM domain-containing protein n=1 Tax=Treponema endosymbiont of Eucomonympha sp. TaxID=1580831 RepID=UPI00078442F5|nr:hypothetical protein [Treponema endosymbiont of Eucomonympha sp.]